MENLHAIKYYRKYNTKIQHEKSTRGNMTQNIYQENTKTNPHA